METPVSLRSGFARICPTGNARICALFLASLLFLGAFVYFALQVKTELKALESAPRDNLHWTLSQLEVDLLVLLSRGEAVADSGADALPEFRRRFDTFYSRVTTLEQGAFMRSVADDSSIRQNIKLIITPLNAAIPVIDGPDAALLSAVAELTTEFRALLPVVRAISLTGVDLFAQRSDESRAAFTLLLLQTAFAGLVLVLALGVSIYFLFRQYRISVRKSEQIASASSRLKQTIDASQDPIIVTDAEKRIVEYNPAAIRVFGIDRDQAVGSDFVDRLMAPDLSDEERAALDKLLSAGPGVIPRLVSRARRLDGTEFAAELSVGAARSDTGPIHIAYIRDISRRREAERAIVEARDKALAADRAKSDFLAVMSHEMRTPLNGVIGVLQILQETGLTDEQQRLVGLAENAGEILLHHVNDVLDIARIEAGTLHFAEEPLDVPALAGDVVELCQPDARNSDTTIRLQADLRDQPLLSDPVRLRQILLNLISNAAKFSPGGHVTVSITEKRRPGGRSIVKLIVADDGIGIDLADQQRIFDDFVTLDPSFNRPAMGVGLGLGITRRLIEGMGGNIKLVSAPGEGSVFTVELPMQIAPAATEPQPVAARGSDNVGQGAAVLVVEDNDTNRLIVSHMLAQQGCEVVEAANGTEGIRLANARRFDLILMDVSMPGVDGIEATKAIKSAGGASTRTPIIGLTAHTSFQKRQVHEKAGFDGCLLKPLRRDKLMEILAGLSDPGWNTWQADAADINIAAGEWFDPDIFGELAGILPAETLAARINMFSAELAAGLRDIEMHMRNDQRRAAAETAHRMVGTAAFLGAHKLEKALREIEASLETQASDQVASQCAAVADIAANTFVALRRCLRAGTQERRADTATA